MRVAWLQQPRAPSRDWQQPEPQGVCSADDPPCYVYLRAIQNQDWLQTREVCHNKRKRRENIQHEPAGVPRGFFPPELYFRWRNLLDSSHQGRFENMLVTYEDLRRLCLYVLPVGAHGYMCDISSEILLGDLLDGLQLPGPPSFTKNEPFGCR